MDNHKCQMTVEKYDAVGSGYTQCGRPVKFRVPEPEMKVEFVCGIHARSLNIMSERIGRDKRCQPLGG